MLLGAILFLYSNPNILLSLNSRLSTLNPSSSDKAPEDKQSDEKIAVHYLIPVTYFTNLKSSITYEELLNSELVTDEANRGFFNNLNETDPLYELSNFVTLKLSKQWHQDLTDKKDIIVLLTPDQVKPWYKTLILEDQNFWAKDFDEEKWPLKFETSQNKQEIASTYSPVQEESRVMLLAVGEIIPARAVDRLGLNKYNNHTYLFDFFKDDIKSADISIGLLENSLLGNPTPCTGCMMFAGDEQMAEALAEVGFDFISTAGNHAGDAGQKAMENTIELLEKNDIQVTGTGKNSNAMYVSGPPLNIAQKQLNDYNWTMLGADDIAYYYWIPSWLWNFSIDPITELLKPIDTNERYGTYTFSKLENNVLKVNQQTVENALDKLIRPEADHGLESDMTIIYMSWGVEYTNKATTHQQNLAHTLIDNGADIIIGSHPHWVQNIEFYKGKPIIYSLGNFIFDQTHTTPTRQGLATKLYFLDNELKSIELVPHQTCGYHQTSNDLAQKYFDGEIELEDLYEIPENEGCIYWMPKPLKQGTEEYKQILERIFEYTSV